MRKKTVIALLLVFAILLTGMLVACNEECTEHVDDNGDLICDKCGANLSTGEDNGNGGQGAKATYTVTIKSMGGKPVETTAYIMEANGDLKAYITTDKVTGSGSKEVDEGTYYVELGSLPDGYVAEARYNFQKDANGYFVNIVLATEVVEGTHSNYALGDVMKDFTVNTVTGEVFKLSKALETYDGVLLNFFYTTCSPCVAEFPFLNEAAGMYSDDIAVICVDTYVNDNYTMVESFYHSNGLTNVNMGIHEVGLFDAFHTSGYPTSVMIDRYGVICLIEEGGLPYLYPFTAMFDYFSADNYVQKLFTSIDELTPKAKPADLGYAQPNSDVIATVMSGANLPADVVYYPETEASDADYYWPFYLSEKEGARCLVSTNNKTFNKRDDNYNTTAAMHADVTLQAGQALSLDYFCSSESGADNFYVLIDGEVIYTISGVGTAWEKCYPYVATEDGTYKVSFIYSKDYDTDEGEDCIYIKNLNVVSASSVDVATYIPRKAAWNPNSNNMGYQNFATVVYNEEDGYYHVGSANGPLLLANLMNYVQDDDSDSATSIYLYALENGFTIEQVDHYPALVNYASYASNSNISGYATVTEELKGLLEKMNAHYPNGVYDRTANGWLRFCRYYDAYGTEKHLDDPIAGLAPFSAYETIVNDSICLDEYPNSVTFDMIIMPRGKLFSFTSVEGGVYRIITDSTKEADGWIFDAESLESRRALLDADHYERISDTNGDGEYTQIEYGVNNVCMVYYFEPGKEYFINLAFYEVTETGTINFKVERLGDTYSYFRFCSNGAYTYKIDPATGNFPVDANGNEIYTMIPGGYDNPIYNEDEDCYYINGSKVYVDFTMAFVNGLFMGSTYECLYDIVENLDEFGEYQEYMEGLLPSVNTGDPTCTPEEDFEAFMTTGCLVVTKDMAEALGYFVSKHTFSCENNWVKLCYFFDYMGPQTSGEDA